MLQRVVAVLWLWRCCTGYAPQATMRTQRVVMAMAGKDEVPSEPVRAPRPASRWKQKAPQSTRATGRRRKPVLRVIAGAARGRKLESPETMLRPMMGRVREAMFSTLVSLGVFRPPRRVSVLDLFCGSGSIGIEALSRGADFAAFVDVSPLACDTALRNAQACGYDDAVALCETAQTALRRADLGGRKFDILSLTPPYEEISYADLLADLADSSLLNDDAVVVVEYPVELGTLPPTLGETRSLIGLRNRRYGRTVLAFYAYRPSGKLPLDPRPDEFDARTW